MDGAAAQGGVIWRVLGAWAGLRASMRAELDRDPPEGRLLFYAVLSSAIWAAGEMMMLSFGLTGTLVGEEEYLGRAAALIGAALFVRPLALYALAALAHAIARGLGGRGSWRDSRAALFWAALVAAPAMIAAAMLALLVTDRPGTASGLTDMSGSLVFAWVAAACFAEAHGFASLWRGLAVVAIMAGLLVASLLAVLALSTGGVPA